MKLEEAIKQGYVKLNIGSWIGNDVLDEWVNVDNFPHPTVDLVCDACELEKHMGKVVNEIKATEVLEHVSLKDSKMMLKSFFNVMKDGAKLHISTPNTTACMQQWIKNDGERERQWSRSIWGEMPEGKPKNEFLQHRQGFDKEKLIKLIEEARFKIDKFEYKGKYNRGLHLWASK